MFCKNCGKEVDENAVVCPYCGVQIKNTLAYTANETCTMAIIGFVLSFFISIAGLVCSILGYRKCRDENLKGKGFAVAGIVISIASIAIVFICIIAVVAAFGCIMSNAVYY